MPYQTAQVGQVAYGSAKPEHSEAGGVLLAPCKGDAKVACFLSSISPEQSLRRRLPCTFLRSSDWGHKAEEPVLPGTLWPETAAVWTALAQGSC